MKRLLHIGLLLLTLTGLFGQSTAMAMAPSVLTAPSQARMAAMTGENCMGMPDASNPGKGPCKKVTLQCIAAMGCSPLIFIDPYTRIAMVLRANMPGSANGRVSHLTGRTYGPEPDPPSLLT